MDVGGDGFYKSCVGKVTISIAPEPKLSKNSRYSGGDLLFLAPYDSHHLVCSFA